MPTNGSRQTPIPSPAKLAERLLAWYAAAARALPWRPLAPAMPDPYAVLVSEFMLQQTQVATVLGYFARFMGRFPTLASLAEASETDVLALWQGLGYYSRGRNLRKCAQAIVANHGGLVPRDVASLGELPGIGPYTAGAISSLAHGEASPAVDGNVRRVMARVLARPRASDEQIAAWVARMLPASRPGDLNSALMDLGATVCRAKSPRCGVCPWAKLCLAAKRGNPGMLPARPRSIARKTEHRQVWVVVLGDKVLARQRPDTGRWAGMYEFPTLPDDPAGAIPPRVTHVGSFSHELSHRHYEFRVLLLKLTSAGAQWAAKLGGTWYDWAEVKRLPMSKAQRKAESLARDVLG